MLDIFGSTTSRQDPRPPSPTPRRFFMDPTDTVQGIGVGSWFKVVSLGKNPVDRGLEAAASTTLTGRLCYDQLFPLAEAVHGERPGG